MPEPLELLMRANLLEIFNERDFDRRLEAAQRTYSENIEFFDPEGSATGREEIVAKAQALLDGAPGFVFTAAEPVFITSNLGHLAWNFGPVGAPPVVKGIDIGFAENGVLTRVYTLVTQTPSAG